jgi:hypothetical protein
VGLLTHVDHLIRNKTNLCCSHSVVTTVRSEAKAESIRKTYPSYGKEKLDFAIVEDIAVEGAFDEAVKSDPPFQGVVSNI